MLRHMKYVVNAGAFFLNVYVKEMFFFAIFCAILLLSEKNVDF